jgi:hypothetical protein
MPLKKQLLSSVLVTRTFLRGVLLVLLMLLTTLCAFARPLTDFDNDGLSDPILLNVDRNKSFSWSAVLSTSGSVLPVGVVGKRGDTPIVDSWFSADGKPAIGVVTQKKSDLIWKVLASTEGERSFTLGKKGNLIVSGGDFNGNSLGDAAVVQNSRGKAVWTIKLDALANGNDRRRIVFGKANDVLFFAKVESVRDSLGYLHYRKRKSPQLIFRTLDETVNRAYTIPRFLSSKRMSRPKPLQTNTNSDDLVFGKKRGNSVTIYIYSITTKKTIKRNFEGSSDFLVGDFLAAPGEEIGIKNNKELQLFNPITNQIITRPVANGIILDKVNVQFLGKKGGSEDKVFGGVGKCKRILPFPSSHIYKTIGSTHFSPGDTRRNTIGLIIKPGGFGPFPSCIDVIDTKNNTIAKMGLYAKGGKWAARYYAGVGCGASTPYNGSAVASKAEKNSGSSDVYLGMGGVCLGPIQANRCRGSAQC